MSLARAGVAVLVCGDAQRSDDGVAMHAVRGLPAAVRAAAAVHVVGQLDTQALLDAAPPCIVLDAVVGVPAGTLVDLPLGQVVVDGTPAPRSSHALPAAIAVGLAQALGADLGRSRLVGVGIADVRFGNQLSEPVAAALPRLIELLSATIIQLAGSPDTGGGAALAARPSATAA